MDPDKKEIKFTLNAGLVKAEKKKTQSTTTPKYGCLKGGKNPTFKQFTRRSSVPITQRQAVPPTTYKHYRKCGKIHNNTVRIILSDQKTVNGIERDKRKLDKHSLATVTDYLAKRNLYTAGSDVPEDILREIYRNAHMAGNVHNNDTDIMVNNFFKGTDLVKEV